ncbi:PEGA domain-containing protein [Asticcacaulis sp. EMRT-3]|uniref:PEGA domain-containing protein n=1 Tax=Asticcacaulis sp. EMRT-3 TaxID=3040349 RepID=UPI0024AF5BAE|nr:PEGA domain-containing protein [Asticcacaulis sp. EMRT-3]MDI7774381.1 PEGA domain-containing protein [Asticcacaulis sp. EMRT-3]
MGQLKAVCLGMAAVSVSALGGCATMTRGTHQDWTVTSDPLGAMVQTNNGFACDTTPCTFKVPRKPGFEVTVSKPGYKTAKFNVVSSVHGGGGAAMAGNVLVGGIIGGIVDANNGSMDDLTPNPLVVKLEKEGGSDAQK